MAAPERPKVRTIVAAAAMGMIVQLRMRPRLLGSTMSPGRDDLNSAMIAEYSVSVMVPAVLAHCEGRGGHPCLRHQLPNRARGALHAT
eukprot:6130578-Prymnesium_polylepis.1